jgi:DNA-binding LytR/AlgR family response regulator
MWKVAVVDDQASVRTQMESYFERYQEERGEHFQIFSFQNAALFLDRYQPEYDLVLMDIDMPGMDGLTAAHRLRKLDSEVVLIFVTNLAQYAINGYEVSAVDFVVKPVSYAKFAFKLERALKLAAPKDRPMILIKTEDGTVAVQRGDITYVEVQGHNLFYHTEEKVYRVRGSLKQVEEEIGGMPFFTCHKCYIVNLAFVDAVRENVVVVAGNEIVVSRPKKKAFMEALAAYYNRAIS